MLVLLSSCLGSLLAQSEGLNHGLVGYWRFDEGAGDTARDESPFRNDGEVKGPDWVVALIQYGLHYYGREGLTTEVPGSESLDIREELSLACWICLSGRLADGSEEDLFYLFAKPHGKVYSLRVEREEFKLQGTVSVEGRLRSITSGASVPLGRWTHVAFTYDSEAGEASLYIDGELDRTDALGPGKIDVNDQNLFIGSAFDPLTQRLGIGALPGVIDEARIYRRVLTPDEVRHLASEPTLAPEQPCANCYAPPSVGKFLMELMPEAFVTQEQFLRALFIMLNRSEELPFDAPIEEIVQFLTELGVIPEIFPLDLGAPITKGEAALLLLRALELEVPFIDQLLLTVGLKEAERAAFEIARREGLIPPGKPEDLLSGRELVAMIVKGLVRFQINAPLGATPTDLLCAGLKLGYVEENVMSVTEADEILQPPPSTS